MSGPLQEERRENAWIGASIVIRGNLTSSEDMTLAGRVEGDVSVRENTLVIARGSSIRGDVIARAVVVHGEVTGTITARGRVEVGATGSVDGDITAPAAKIAEGAELNGRLTLSGPGAKA